MFERAERLGMTVGDMSSRMSYDELVCWMALDGLRQKEHEKAARLAQKNMKSRRR